MILTSRDHRLLLDCRDHVFHALCRAMDNRRNDPDWERSERFAVANAANEWAQAHGFDRLVTVGDVERIEVGALGHVDYGSKLALYVAEFVVLASPSFPPEETQ